MAFLWLWMAWAFAGETMKSAYDGWQATAPDGWQLAEQDGKYAVGNGVDPVVIIVGFQAGLTLAAMKEQAAAGLQESGVSLMPTAAPSAFASKAGEAVAVDLSGVGADGTPMAGRVVGIVSPTGGLVVLGLGAATHQADIRARTDAIATSVRFFTPEKPKASGDVATLKRTVCSSGGGSVATWTSRLSFDGRGNVSAGSEMVASGQFKDSAGNQTGSWGATSADSNAGGGVYSVEGDAVTIRWNNGAVQRCTVHWRVGTEITELTCDGKLYGAPLCG